MSILLPSTPRARSATPRFLDFGSTQRSPLGGPDLRVNRLGDRFAVDYQLPPMKNDQARVWIARLIRGRREAVRAYFPQPGFSSSAYPNGVNAHYRGTNRANLWLTSAPTRHLKEGQFFTVVLADGSLRLHYVTEDASTTGPNVEVGYWPPAREDWANGLIIQGNPAMIEGYVSGDESSWNIDEARVYGLGFTVSEKA